MDVWQYLDPQSLVGAQEAKELIEVFLKDPIISSKYTLKALYSQMRERLACPVKKITVPILLINGDQDVLFKIDFISRIFECLTCKKKMEIIEDGYHLLLHEQLIQSVEIVV